MVLHDTSYCMHQFNRLGQGGIIYYLVNGIEFKIHLSNFETPFYRLCLREL